MTALNASSGADDDQGLVLRTDALQEHQPDSISKRRLSLFLVSATLNRDGTLCGVIRDATASGEHLGKFSLFAFALSSHPSYLPSRRVASDFRTFRRSVEA